MQHSSTLLNVFTQLLSYSTPVMLITVRERLEYQPSHTQPRLLCHRSPCDLEFLSPSPVSSLLSFPPETGPAQQPTEQNTPSQLWSQSTVSHVVRAPSPSELSLSFPAEHLPALDHTWGGDKGGVRSGEFGWVFPPPCCFCSLSPSSLPHSHLSLFLLFFFSFSRHLPAESRWPWCQRCPAALGHRRPRVPKEKEECEQLAGLQSIVPGGLLSVVSHPLVLTSIFHFSPAGYCNQAEI